MRRPAASFSFADFLLGLVLTFGLFGCGACQQTPPPKPPVAATAPPAAPVARPAATPAIERIFPVMLGIDVLEAQGFAAVKGKRIGLLTNPAGVNRRGVQTVEVLHKAPGVQLVALYAVEHGIYGDQPAQKTFPDMTDRRTGLPIYSLYSDRVRFKPTPAQLQPIDALVIDLQDIGTRSYTFTGAMKTAMQACFENGKEVIVLDRPNPLGGLKVGGPGLDPDLLTDVGRFRVPYVHGLTMAELARMAATLRAPGGIDVSDAVRARGKLTVVPMRGWTRSMRWPETGLKFVPPSPGIQDWAAVMGYPMTGLGAIFGGFSHGVGSQHLFRGVHHPNIRLDVYERELRALNLPGIQFRRISVPNARTGQPSIGLYIEIADYGDWEPTDLNFWLMHLAAKLQPKNPFAAVPGPKEREFLIHVGSRAFYQDLVANGARADIGSWLRTWREHAQVYQQESKKYWLYY